jgi:hypothetical protein
MLWGPGRLCLGLMDTARRLIREIRVIIRSCVVTHLDNCHGILKCRSTRSVGGADGLRECRECSSFRIRNAINISPTRHISHPLPALRAASPEGRAWSLLDSSWRRTTGQTRGVSFGHFKVRSEAQARRIPLLREDFAKEGWTRPKEKYREAAFQRSHRGGCFKLPLIHPERF